MTEASSSREELDSKAATIDLPALNKWVVNTRKHLRKAQLHAVQDLCRKIREARRQLGKLNEAKNESNEKETESSPSDDSGKLQRRVDGLLSEVSIVKRVALDEVAKLALATDSETLNTSRFLRHDNLNEKCLKTHHISFERLTSALRRIMAHRSVQESVENFRREHADWQKIAAFVMYKPSGRRFKKIKTEKQRRMIPLIAFYPIPNVSNSFLRLSSIQLHKSSEDQTADSGAQVEGDEAKADQSTKSSGRNQGVRINDVLASIFTTSSDETRQPSEVAPVTETDTEEKMDCDGGKVVEQACLPKPVEVKRKATKKRKRESISSDQESFEIPESMKVKASTSNAKVKVKRGTAVIKTVQLNEMSSDDEVRLDSDAEDAEDQDREIGANSKVKNSRDAESNEEEEEEDDFFVKPGSNQPVLTSVRGKRSVQEDDVEEEDTTFASKRKMKSCFVERLGASSSESSRPFGFNPRNQQQQQQRGFAGRFHNNSQFDSRGQSQRPIGKQGQYPNSNSNSNARNWGGRPDTGSNRRFSDQAQKPRNFDSQQRFGAKKFERPSHPAGPSRVPAMPQKPSAPADTGISEEHMHASWKAAKQRKEAEKQAMQSALSGAGTGKRIVFNDDD